MSEGAKKNGYCLQCAKHTVFSGVLPAIIFIFCDNHYKIYSKHHYIHNHVVTFTTNSEHHYMKIVIVTIVAYSSSKLSIVSRFGTERQKGTLD